MLAKKEKAIITDKLVFEKTGKGIEDWFKILDKKINAAADHNGIFELISNTNGLKILGEWNQNLLATTYEWSRGLKERGEKKNGFEVSVSKTINVPVDVSYNAWLQEKIKNKWLNNPIIIRKTTPNKSIRITWTDGKTSLGVDFYPKGEHKSQVVVQHLKIANSQAASELKVYWRTTLELLKSLLEK